MANPAANPMEIRIRAYNMAKIPSAMVEGIGQEAKRILGEAGIQVVWLDCSREDQALQCGAPRTATDFVFRLVVPAPPDRHQRKPQALGQAWASREGGALANVVCPPVESLPYAAQSIYPRVLGHTAVHEIGHLLLGSDAHHYNGIMRARWDDFDWQRMIAGTLLFTKDQAGLLRQSISVRYQLAEK
jgi:hypothetical protein